MSDDIVGSLIVTNQISILNKTIKELSDLVNNFARPNLRIIKNFSKDSKSGSKSNLVGVGLVGMSLFVIKNNKRLPSVKLIDFAHPTVINKKSSKDSIVLALEEAENFLRGLEGILLMLNLFYEEI